MHRPDLKDADEHVVKFIIAQGEARLDGQVAFAAVQDGRAVSILSASASLAAASTAVAAGAFSAAPAHAALGWAGVVAALGFAGAALIALWAIQARNFHSRGWYPCDFEGDIEARKSLEQIAETHAQDLEIRLRANAIALHNRASAFTAAALVLAVTPIFAVVVALLATH